MMESVEPLVGIAYVPVVQIKVMEKRAPHQFGIRCAEVQAAGHELEPDPGAPLLRILPPCEVQRAGEQDETCTFFPQEKYRRVTSPSDRFCLVFSIKAS